MIEVRAISNLEDLQPLKAEYLARTTAPLDGMWLCGFLPLAQHFGLYRGGALAGYVCINDEGYMLQFYICQDQMSEVQVIFADMISGNFAELPEIKGAFASTAEPDYLSLCLDNFSAFEVNALMYQLSRSLEISKNSDPLWSLTALRVEHLPEAIEFCIRNIGAPEEWLRGYLSNLIERQEVFGCWQDGELIGTGENRKFDDVQQGYTDVGVIVSEQQRGKGLATWILQQLVGQALAMDLKPMCSTERDNIAAQKAISRAGFIANNRIFQFKV